jgi:hypothetical protein
MLCFLDLLFYLHAGQPVKAVKLTPIQVECYAGAKVDEAPRRFILEGRTIEIGQVLDRWYQVESQPEWPRADYFKVRSSDMRDYLLKHDLEANEWFLGQQW